MAGSNACWGIELGSASIKAVKLVRDGDNVRLADFIVLPHKKVLSTPDLDRDEAMRVALGTLTSQYDLEKATVAISAAGHEAFIRFAKLPPVDPKKVASIVKFEAAQQIPFPLEEVEWDFQTFAREDAPDIEVGIFAMTRARVMARLDACNDANLKPDALNLSPIAVFNALAYDLPIGEDTPGTAIIDIGTTATDLIIADQGRVWVRTFPIGGHNFTEAIVEAFKLPYLKAEKLKREAEQSKHKRHVFQSMRPVFTDLAQDVQRSLAFYRQLHPESEIKRVIGLGSTFRLIGLRKYLSQQIGVDVARCERFRRLAIEGTAEADFQAVALGMATAYGLALQGLGLAAIDANLVPTPVVRETLWQRKKPVFVMAAALSLAAGAATFVGPTLEAGRVSRAKADPGLRQVQQVKTLGNTLRGDWQRVSQDAQIGFAAENVLRLYERGDVYARFFEDMSAMLATAPAVEPGGFRLTSLRVDYQTPTGAAPKYIEGPGGSGGRQPSARGGDDGRGRGGRGDANRGGRGGDPSGQPAGPPPQFGSFFVTMVVESDHPDLSAHVDRTLLAWLRENAAREGAAVRYSAPSADEISITQAVGEGVIRPASPDRPTAPRPAGGAGASADINSLAPLPPPATPAASDRPVYRYVLNFRATLAAPEKPIDLSPEDVTASAEGVR